MAKLGAAVCILAVALCACVSGASPPAAQWPHWESRWRGRLNQGVLASCTKLLGAAMTQRHAGPTTPSPSPAGQTTTEGFQELFNGQVSLVVAAETGTTDNLYLYKTLESTLLLASADLSSFDTDEIGRAHV